MYKCYKPNVGEDDDVKRERTRVGCNIQELSETEAVVLQHLRKEYGSKVAVQNLTVGKLRNRQMYDIAGRGNRGQQVSIPVITPVDITSRLS